MISPGLAARRRAGRHAPAALRACPKRRGRTPLSGHGPGNRDRRAMAWAARGGAAGLVVALIALGLGACSSGPSSAQLPPKATQTSAPSPASPTPSAASAPTRKAAIAAYLAMWPAGDQAERTGTARQARTILAPVATPSYIRVLLAGMAPFWRHHEIARGHVVDHIQSATVLTGQDGQFAAIVVDCQDASHRELVSVRGGHTRVIPHSSGRRQIKFNASLAYRHGRWLVDNVTFEGNKC